MAEQEQLRGKLQQWLAARHPEREGLTISEFTSPEAGASNETLLFDISWTEQGASQTQALVARLEASGEGIFPEYDLPLQYRTMQRLQNTPVKVPTTLGMEMDTSVIGKPFFIMERLHGRYMADNPPYQMEGWLTQESPQVCGAIWENAIAQMGAVNKVDWEPLGFADLWDNKTFATPLQQQLAYYESFLAWAEILGRPFPKLHPVLAYLKNNQPSNEPLALCWGDAKPPNLMIAENSADIIGVLDWEMVHLGNPVHDLSWWFVLDDSLTKGLGLPKVDGLPDRQKMTALWEQHSGHSAAELDYYELLSNFQFAVIMHRVGTRLTAQGYFKPEDQFDLNNNSTLLIDEQMAKFGIS
ncbi:phosphotransferase family protein [Oceanicoccus sp. KOV_DT_Chl]|uniref:phosphotransferase family protein n=1 Tax=Oceanicoccus sp. KOV_DT_Chl TaxID=1904639 RepID=UPI000C7AA38C|nr:phosphotransferase family protein [Oceanicoccus sp. KOV_DT_Chl]